MPTTALAAGAALVCFAANSVLCRLALLPGWIDPATFAAVRFGTGAVALLLLTRGRRGGSTRSAVTLVIYAVPFSLAYMQLPAGLGALILFGSVQAAMIGWGIVRGEHPRALEWAGLLLSLGGLVALVLPSISAPPPGASLLMMLAGAGWGAYSLQGRATREPLVANAGNFLGASPALIALSGAFAVTGAAHVTLRGLALATVSGVIATGLGYAIWYAALPHLKGTRAAIIQLSVPVLATLGGIALLHERLTLRVLGSGAAIFGGVLLALLSR